MGTHHACYGSDSDPLFVREVAMMFIMEQLTDKENWHKKIFDEEIVAKWRKEALEYPDELLWIQATGRGRKNPEQLASEWVRRSVDEDGLDPTYKKSWSSLPRLQGIISERGFDYCVKELRNKAKYYQESGIIPSLDATASVAKSDVIMPSALHDALRKAFDRLKADQASSPDWHPGSNEMVQDLVHPSMYPLVYGRTRAFKDEVVGVQEAIRAWAGKGEVIPKDTTGTDVRRRPGDIPASLWSDTYQWLPANMAFQEDGSVRFTSYINNLHPNKYPEIYRAIEELVGTVALPMWDQCLATCHRLKREGAGRTKSRFSLPEDPDDENAELWIPSDPAEMAGVEFDWNKMDPRYLERIKQDGDNDIDPVYMNKLKWEVLRQPAQMEPEEFEELDYAPKSRLAEKFKESGLQIIVKIVSIELTPEKPEVPAGGWHVEGQMNESICATALYYLDSENITPSSLSFRMQTSSYYDQDVKVGQDSFHWLERVLGVELGCSMGSSCLQNYGTVETRQGRVLAFPNVFQHKVSSFRLQDHTKPGHRRFIALWLVDPHTRIISTANVPPQQQDWWAESALGTSREARQEALSKLPAELVRLLQDSGVIDQQDAEKVVSSSGGKMPPEVFDMLREHFEVNLMSGDEAKDHRKNLMKARTSFRDETNEEWNRQEYSFCEH
ncbi:hypothetical protein DL771_006078 [Monosporascus sp. 5C6A]|nr:hypothetical protein DL771_006078 [Monosporascus sp. 5C6A]